MNPMQSYNVHVVYREGGEIGNSIHLVYARSTNDVLVAMQNFYGNDLMAAIIL